VSDLKKNIQEAVKAIRKIDKSKPKIGIVLGTGLGGLANKIKVTAKINYADIPHFPISTVDAHASELILGTLAGKTIIALSGRFHYYEGYTMQEVTFPIRVLKALGAKTLFVSNACGGLNPQFNAGDIMVIEDHINFMGDSPLIGPNDDTLGPRFPDMCEPYSKKLIQLAETVSLDLVIPLKKGVYLGCSGPALETRAEYRMMRIMGADVVGMSTVPEVIVAIHCGLQVLGLSVITDECMPDALKPANIDQIIAIANKAEPKLAKIVSDCIAKIK
jgi:purine-nucleoside phosphorylase